MELLLLLALGVFGLAAIGGAMAGVFDPRERVRRILRRARTVPVREVRDGQVAKVVGRVRAVGEPLRAPLSRRRCVYWEVEVTEWNGTRGLVTRRVHEQCDFLLEDGSARAFVAVERAVIAAKVDARWGRHDPENEAARALLEGLGVPDPGRSGAQLTYTEAVIEVGEEAAASGRCAWESDPNPGLAAGYRDVPLRVVLRAGQGELVVVMGTEKEARWQG